MMHFKRQNILLLYYCAKIPLRKHAGYCLFLCIFLALLSAINIQNHIIKIQSREVTYKYVRRRNDPTTSLSGSQELYIYIYKKYRT
jgi:hypothetical protein